MGRFFWGLLLCGVAAACVSGPPVVERPAIGRCVGLFGPEAEVLEQDSCFVSAEDGSLRVVDTVRTRLRGGEDERLTLFHVWLPPPHGCSAGCAAYVRGDGTVVLTPNFENGPDPFEHGRARYLAPNGKMGFVDAQLNVVIPARHDFVFPFQCGQAWVCDGCESRREGELSRRVGGKWSTIDRSGQVLRTGLRDRDMDAPSCSEPNTSAGE